MKRDQKYWNQLAKLLGNELNEAEQDRFRKHLEQEKELKRESEWMKQTLESAHPHPSKKYSDNTAKAWENLNERIELDEDQNVMRPELRTLQMNRFLRIAAAIAILISIAIPSVYIGIRGSDNDGIHVAKEGIMSVDLPDGSRVLLNQGSTLEVNQQRFQDNRTVSLKGEGYFDVLKDPSKPFQVRTGKVVVTVLGTSFNVKESKQEVEVLVESGKVKVATLSGAETALLEAGQFGIVTDRISTATAEDPNYLSWKTKRFKFVDVPVSAVLGTLQNAYHVKLNSSDIDLSDLRLTSTYNEQSFDAILSTICTAFNLDYVKQEEVYILRAR